MSEQRIEVVIGPSDATLAEGDKAWTRAYINDLPDSAFLYVESGGEKDETGRTVPRTLRHLPYMDANGSVDLPHLRNALSRLGQTETGEAGGERWLTESLREQLRAKAQRILEEHSEKSVAEPEGPQWWADVKSTLRDFADWIKEAMPGRDITPEPDEDQEQAQGFKLFEGSDGRTWIMTWTTNAFKDRDNEIFTTKSIEDYVARHEDEDQKGKYQFWHLPGTEFGDILWQGVSGRFLVEAGPFDDTPTGKAFKAFFQAHAKGHPVIAPEGWGCSHGFVYSVPDRRDKVFDWFEKAETSVLPAHKAANPYTDMEVLEMGTLSQRQKDALKEIGGEELVDQVERRGQQRTKDLEDAGVAYKAGGGFSGRIRSVAEKMDDGDMKQRLMEIADEMDVEGPEKEPEETKELAMEVREMSEQIDGEDGALLDAVGSAMLMVSEDAERSPEMAVLVKAMSEALHLDELSDFVAAQEDVARQFEESIKELADEVRAIKERIGNVERTDDERLAEKATRLPRFSWFRASDAAETVLAEDSDLKGMGPEVPTVIDFLAGTG